MKALAALCLASFAMLSGCATRYNFSVGLSPLLEEAYGIYPSVEVDLALVTESEADDIRAAGVDKYFTPGNQVRQKTGVYTMFFSNEKTAPVAVPPRDKKWYGWLKKNPTHFFLIAGLPPPEKSEDAPKNEGQAQGEDPRMTLVEMEKKLLTQNMYFLVEPQKLSQSGIVPEDPRNPKQTKKK